MYVCIDMLLLLLHDHHAQYNIVNIIYFLSIFFAATESTKPHSKVLIGIHAFECFKSLSGANTSAKHLNN